MNLVMEMRLQGLFKKKGQRNFTDLSYFEFIKFSLKKLNMLIHLVLETSLFLKATIF